MVPGGYVELRRESVDELEGVFVLPTHFIDEEVQQSQSRSAGARVNQLRQRRHPETHRVARVAALYARDATGSEKWRN